MKFKVGDKVTIRDDLEEKGYFGEESTEGDSELSFMESVYNMPSVSGQEAKIINVTKGFYRLNLLNDDYYWSLGMFCEKDRYEDCLFKLKDNSLWLYKKGILYSEEGKTMDYTQEIQRIVSAIYLIGKGNYSFSVNQRQEIPPELW